MTLHFTPRDDAPLLLFGGPYSNLEALQAVLDEARARDIPCANLLCTGDLVAYCADPRAVVDEVRARGIAVVQGNCEQSLGEGADDCGCGFEAGSSCDLLSVQWYRHARAALDPARCRWLSGLPPTLAFEWGGARWLAVHGTAARNNQFVFASHDARELAGEVPPGVDIVLAGHCGIPFNRGIGAALWHNAGVIGMPANDGTPRGWFSIAERTGGGIRLTTCALEYDAAAASAKMRRRGLPGGYADALLSGLWPSLDVLPPRERDATGVALRTQTAHWRCAGAGVAPVARRTG